LPFLPLFHIRFDLRSVATAAFKPVCAILQLGVARYGRQKRQDRGKNGNEVARWMAKTA
jgi:translation initiation factor IF-3